METRHANLKTCTEENSRSCNDNVRTIITNIEQEQEHEHYAIYEFISAVRFQAKHDRSFRQDRQHIMRDYLKASKFRYVGELES